MVALQYFNDREKKWIDCGDFHNEQIAWISLGGDDINYRTVDKETGNVLTDKSTSNHETYSRFWVNINK